MLTGQKSVVQIFTPNFIPNFNSSPCNVVAQAPVLFFYIHYSMRYSEIV